MYLQKLGQLQQNGLLGNLGMGSASGAEQMMAHGQQLAQMGGMNNQLERMKQISQQSADQAMQMEKQRQAQQGAGLASLLGLGLAAATGGVKGSAKAETPDIMKPMDEVTKGTSLDINKFREGLSPEARFKFDTDKMVNDFKSGNSLGYYDQDWRQKMANSLLPMPRFM